jgi:glycosyltransferase involved in cell wall biosynthesis
MEIYGGLICQNNVEDIIRCIDSIACITDSIFVVDGFSDDRTVDVLKAYQDAYNLKIFQHKFENIDSQRNYLLEQIPKNSWVIAPDSDEKFNHKLSVDLRDFILNEIDPSIYSEDRQKPICIGIPWYTLMGDVKHYTDSWVGMLMDRVYFYDKNLHFTGGYHARQVYNDSDSDILMLPGKPGWAIFHYAFLNRKRVEKAKKEIAEGKRDYKEGEWDLSKRDVKDLIKPLW